MHTLVHIALSFVAVSLLLMAVLVLLLIEMIKVRAEDDGPESDPVRKRERKPNPFGARQHTSDDLSAGGWPHSTLADRLPSPAGEPSADRHS
jgi:hypothetical protein